MICFALFLFSLSSAVEFLYLLRKRSRPLMRCISFCRSLNLVSCSTDLPFLSFFKSSYSLSSSWEDILSVNEILLTIVHV